MIPLWVQAFNQGKYDGPSLMSAAFPRLTPLLAPVAKPSQAKWGGQGVFFDVVLSKYAPKGTIYVLDPGYGVNAKQMANLPVIVKPGQGMITGLTP